MHWWSVPSRNATSVSIRKPSPFWASDTQHPAADRTGKQDARDRTPSRQGTSTWRHHVVTAQAQPEQVISPSPAFHYNGCPGLRNAFDGILGSAMDNIVQRITNRIPNSPFHYCPLYHVSGDCPKKTQARMICPHKTCPLPLARDTARHHSTDNWI